MKKWLIKIIILMLYSVPYVFLAMNGDAKKGTMWFYLLMIVAFALLVFVTKKTNNKILVFIGNIISFLSSLICLFQFRTEKWDWYFKPLTDVQLLIMVSIVTFITQLIFIHKRKKDM